MSHFNKLFFSIHFFLILFSSLVFNYAQALNNKVSCIVSAEFEDYGSHKLLFSLAKGDQGVLSPIIDKNSPINIEQMPDVKIVYNKNTPNLISISIEDPGGFDFESVHADLGFYKGSARMKYNFGWSEFRGEVVCTK